MDFHAAHGVRQSTDVFLCRSAASADNCSSSLNQCHSGLCKLFWSHAVNGLLTFQFRKSGIWLCNERNRRILCHRLDKRNHLHRSGRAVDADCIHAERLQYDNRRFRRCAKKCSSILVVSQCYHDWQITDLTDCKDCCAALLQAHHGLHHEQIHARFRKHARLLLIHIHQFLKHQLTHREKLLSGHRHVSGNQSLTFHRLLRQLYQSRVNLNQTILQTILFQLDPVSGKCRRIHDVRSCFYILALHLKKHLWMLHHPLLRTDTDRHSCFHQICSCRSV